MRNEHISIIKFIVFISIVLLVSNPAIGKDALYSRNINKDDKGVTGPENKNAEKKEKQPLSLNRFVSMVSEKLPELKKNRLKVDKAKNKKYAAESLEDFYLDGGFNYFREKEYSFYTIDAKGYIANLGVSRKIIQSGTALSTGINYSATEISGATGGVNKYKSPSIYFGVKQPILYNSFGFIDRFAKNDAKMKLDVEKLQKKENDKSVLNYYKKIYFDWIQFNEVTKILEQSIVNAEKLMNQTKRKYRSGLTDNDNVQKTVSAVLKYREQYTQNKIIYDTITKELSLFINTGQYIPDNSEFNNLFNKSISREYIYVPFNKTRNCEIFQLTKKNLGYNKEIAENKLLPELNIIGNIELKSREETFTNSISEMKEVDYSIGFSVTYPIGNTAVKSELKGVNLSIEEINQEYDAANNLYKKKMQNIILSAKGNKEIFRLKKESIKSLRSKYNTENKKYNQARLDLAFLVDTINSIANEQVGVFQLKKQMINLYFDYINLTE